jgi:hypothetical protein
MAQFAQPICGVDDHCCWLRGEPCRFLEEDTVPGRRWACGLLRELNSWGAVSADSRWIEHVKPTLDGLGISSCDDFPRPGETCATCGQAGKMTG